MSWLGSLLGGRKRKRAGEIASALDVPTDGFNDHEKEIVAKVRKHGWFCTSVFAEEGSLGFSYSTGFWVNLGRPELLIFSVPPEMAHAVLWAFYRAPVEGTWPIGEPLSGFVENLPVMLMPVAKAHYATYPLSSRWFYGGEEFPALQVVWPDTEGRFPWEEGADPRFGDSQPDLSDAGWRALAGPGRA